MLQYRARDEFNERFGRVRQDVDEGPYAIESYFRANGAKFAESFDANSFITLNGANVGTVSILEARGRSDYLRVIRNVVEDVSFRPGERILEVGCGSGVLSRWLAQRSTKINTPLARV